MSIHSHAHLVLNKVDQVQTKTENGFVEIVSEEEYNHRITVSIAAGVIDEVIRQLVLGKLELSATVHPDAEVKDFASLQESRKLNPTPKEPTNEDPTVEVTA